MIKILFVCHGNICRSPMAACVLQDMVDKAGRAEEFLVDSAATSREELGNPIYPPAVRKLKAEGVSLSSHRAIQMTRADYQKYDLLLGADSANIRNMARIAGGDPEGKIHRLLDYSERPRDIADPWYTGNFDVTFDDIVEGCRALLASLDRDRQ
ncbi:MAG: low molecular weight phosphotyrosine protein phosphatase [Ruminiclostridium sp.]|nr:low molecular weight phosphotyrosine protein phosphatase [Ruminiclostridium sp.]